MFFPFLGVNDNVELDLGKLIFEQEITETTLSELIFIVFYKHSITFEISVNTSVRSQSSNS
jgi:hypothetical protein